MQSILYQWQLSRQNPFKIEHQIIPPGFENRICDMHAAVHLGILFRGELGALHEPYDLFLTGSWEVHGDLASAPGAELVLLTVLPEAVLGGVIGNPEPVRQLLYLPSLRRRELFCTPEIRQILRDFCAANRDMTAVDDPVSRQRLWLKIIALFCDIAGAVQQDGTVAVQQKFLRLQPVFAHLAELKDLPLTAVKAAQMCCMSESYFSHLFREFTGMSFSCYELTFRLNGAVAELHSRPGAGIKQIAAEWGFCDSSHFSKVCKRHFGVTPSGYLGK